MSTKIYNGFRFPDTIRDMAALSAWQQRMNPIMCGAAQESLVGYCVRAAVSQFDLECVRYITDKKLDDEEGETVSGNALMSQVARRLMDRQQEVRATSRRDPAVDVSSEVIVFPGSDGRLYGVCYIENRDLSRCFLKTAGVEEFAFYNNSDPPDNVDEASWEARGKIWKELLGDDAPRHRGFRLEWTGEIEHVSYDALREGYAKAIPTLEARSRRVAEALATQNIPPGPGLVSRLLKCRDTLSVEEIGRAKNMLLPVIDWELLIASDRSRWLAQVQQQWLASQGVEADAAPTSSRPAARL